MTHMWAPPPPSLYPPDSPTPSLSASDSESDSNRNIDNPGTSSLNKMTVFQWSHGDALEARFVIFCTADRQWKLPLDIFYRKSAVLRQFVDSPLNESKFFLHDLDASGCQQIVLREIESMEAEEFLKALYNADEFEPPPTPTSLSSVLAVLKLSTRYQVLFLRRRALAHLVLAYPTTLDHWDRRHLRSTFPLQSFGSNDNTSYYDMPEVAETLKVIRAAHDFQAPWILPSAFYECCRYNQKSIIQHPLFSDGTVPLNLQMKILIGYTEQVELAMQEVLGFLRMSSAAAKKAGCTQILKCADARMETEEMALSWVKQFPLEIWSEHAWDDEQTRIMCTNCRRLCTGALQAGRNRAWAKLPEIFRLPDWQKLEELQQEMNV